VYSETELRARCETLLDNYCKTVRIEAKTMLWMTRRQILPAISGFAAELSERAVKRKALLPEAGCVYESSLAAELSSLIDEIHRKAAELEDALLHSGSAGTGAEDAAGIRDALLPRMQSLRIACDEAETKTDARAWPFPSYAELLFSV
ncbi:MAG: glutamine synthetase type III, partial [Oscillospiraceae bacterium]|nr:glutamine synthetase type III [Oscillospiraceae bacterium]